MLVGQYIKTPVHYLATLGRDGGMPNTSSESLLCRGLKFMHTALAEGRKDGEAERDAAHTALRPPDYSVVHCTLNDIQSCSGKGRTLINLPSRMTRRLAITDCQAACSEEN